VPVSVANRLHVAAGATSRRPVRWSDLRAPRRPACRGSRFLRSSSPLLDVDSQQRFVGRSSRFPSAAATRWKQRSGTRFTFTDSDSPPGRESRGGVPRRLHPRALPLMTTATLGCGGTRATARRCRIASARGSRRSACAAATGGQSHLRERARRRPRSGDDRRLEGHPDCDFPATAGVARLAASQPPGSAARQEPRDADEGRSSRRR